MGWATPRPTSTKSSSCRCAQLQGAWDRIAWRAVYYAPVLQRNERAIFDRMRPQLRWEGLRELMLFGFSDAASLEHKKDQPRAQERPASSTRKNWP